MTETFQSTLAYKRDVVRSSKINEDKRLRDARGLWRADRILTVHLVLTVRVAGVDEGREALHQHQVRLVQPCQLPRGAL